MSKLAKHPPYFFNHDLYMLDPEVALPRVPFCVIKLDMAARYGLVEDPSSHIGSPSFFSGHAIA